MPSSPAHKLIGARNVVLVSPVRERIQTPRTAARLMLVLARRGVSVQRMRVTLAVFWLQGVPWQVR